MEDKNIENIILYLIVGFAGGVFATITRLFTLMMGFDAFTANACFFLAIIVSFMVYLSIQVVLRNLLLPWIGKIIVLIPFFRRNINAIKPTEIQSLDIKAELHAELHSTSLDEIRKAHHLAEENKQDRTRATAILYTQTIFAPFILDQDLNRLCHYIDLYSERKELNQITPIKVSDQINTTDVYHFGWNLWNHFRISDQKGMAIFLKKVFAPTLKEVTDIETIKKKLRIQDPNCTIKLNSNLFEQE
ncbi:MAG TPA: hypothetical protein VFC65_06935 [Prolixibacteraceae bacterium]|nr:hypothetical protein [Prolixibacteraceae bacterium]